MRHMVDVCGGKMTLREVIREIEYYMLRSPEKLIIKIIRQKGGYYTTLYITEKDFKGGGNQSCVKFDYEK